MDKPRQQIRLKTPQILDDPAPMEQICSNRQLLGIEEKRQRPLDVLQSRPSRRLDQDICTRRRESGETLRLTPMAAHDQPAPTVNRQRPHSDGHPPALYNAEATPIPRHEHGHRHSHNLRTSDPPRRAKPAVRDAGRQAEDRARCDVNPDPYGVSYDREAARARRPDRAHRGR